LAAIGAEFNICKALRTSPKRRAAMTDSSKRVPSTLGLRGSGDIKGVLERSTASFHKASGSDFHLLSLVLTSAEKLFFFDNRLPARTGVHKTHFGKMKKSVQLLV
jgi:hypothetical protein